MRFSSRLLNGAHKGKTALVTASTDGIGLEKGFIFNLQKSS